MFRDILGRLLPGGLLLNADLAHCGEDQDQSWDLWLRTIAHLGATPDQVEGYEESVKAGVSFLTDEDMKALLGRGGFSQSHHLFRAILINAWRVKQIQGPRSERRNPLWSSDRQLLYPATQDLGSCTGEP